MKTLTGYEKIQYLIWLKKYEFEQAKKRPAGEKVRYYKIQTEWINEELKELKRG
ncbi:MAG: hypothetical protein K6D96_01710 [Acetatifactor sp.]|nr:hypothetical protein [Acetatifactor sp.]